MHSRERERAEDTSQQQGKSSELAVKTAKNDRKEREALFCGLDGIHETAVSFCAASGSLNRKRVCGVIRIPTPLLIKIQFPATPKCKYELSDSVNSSGSAVKGC